MRVLRSKLANDPWTKNKEEFSDAILNASQNNEAEIFAQRDRVKKLKELLSKVKNDELVFVLPVKVFHIGISCCLIVIVSTTRGEIF